MSSRRSSRPRSASARPAPDAWRSTGTRNVPSAAPRGGRPLPRAVPVNDRVRPAPPGL